MSHSRHNHSHGENLGIAFVLNSIFVVIELVGGLMTNSLAILSDALHDLGDSISIALSWFLERYSYRREDSAYTYGYRRFSLLGAAINGAILTLGSLFIAYHAIQRVLAPEPVVAQGMMALAVLGVLVNGAAVWRMRGASSLNEKVISLHLQEDVLGWVVVLLGSIAIWLTGITVIDPALSLFVAGYIFFNAARNLSASLRTFLQGVPVHVDVEAVRKMLLGSEGVRSLHDLHVWSLDGEYTILSAHIVVDEDTSVDGLAELRDRLKEHLRDHGIDHPTIEWEFPGSECGDAQPVPEGENLNP